MKLEHCIEIFLPPLCYYFSRGFLGHAKEGVIMRERERERESDGSEISGVETRKPHT